VDGGGDEDVVFATHGSQKRLSVPILPGDLGYSVEPGGQQ
jgi:hypothetical protein